MIETLCVASKYFTEIWPQDKSEALATEKRQCLIKTISYHSPPWTFIFWMSIQSFQNTIWGKIPQGGVFYGAFGCAILNSIGFCIWRCQEAGLGIWCSVGLMNISGTTIWYNHLSCNLLHFQSMYLLWWLMSTIFEQTIFYYWHRRSVLIEGGAFRDFQPNAIPNKIVQFSRYFVFCIL